MLNITIIGVGSLGEDYLRAACAEYTKRLRGICGLNVVEIKERRLPANASEAHISAALEAEGKMILAAIPPRSYKIALCVEGKSLTSEMLAEHIGEVSARIGTVCFIIGSSHGLSEILKKTCDMRFSLSGLTFPHQLVRVLLLEAVYRSVSILNGSKYHK